MTENDLYVDICLELGECYTQTGDVQAAYRNYFQARNHAPDNPQPYICLGQLALQEERWEQAQIFLAKALELDGREDKALSGLGAALLKTGNKAAAWDEFQQALKINPENREALLGLAQAADDPGQLSLAAEHLQRHLQIILVDFPVLLSLAKVLVRQGKIPEAQEALRKVLLFYPDNRDALALNQELEDQTTASASAAAALEPPDAPITPGLIARLNEIPSETEIAERIFLYLFFARQWSGDRHVCEMGPFLGGTTRAIAMGMLANSRRHQDSRLYTVDRFDDYYNAADLASYVQPLFSAGILDGRLKKQLEHNASSFKEVFIALHQHQTYFPLVVMQEQVLPRTPEETAAVANLFQLAPELEFSAAFVDGCKSWYATKYFMSEMSNSVSPGAYFLFQDYGWFTCFWIPVFIELCKDHFQLEDYVKHTYAFRLTKALNPQLIDRLVPDDPQSLGRSYFGKVFETLIAEATRRGDAYGPVVHTLQHAASLAYLGYREEAKGLIMELSRQPYAAEYQGLIQLSLKSPTYWPNGQGIKLP